MRKLSARLALALLVLTTTAGIADAKGGRTSAADCKAGSSDPDCRDEPDAKGTSRTASAQQPAWLPGVSLLTA